MKLLVVFLSLVILSSCSYDNLEIAEDTTGYPPEIANIIVNKCATAGCHNDISKMAAGGLTLETWNGMFEGSGGGAVVVPYRPDYSSMMYFINTDSTQGLALTPQMPYNLPPLSQNEYLVLKKWIEEGAPDKNGFVKFSDNPERKKLFIAHQQTDVVTVIDLESGLIMRDIDIGATTANEFSRMIGVSPDQQYWFTSFFDGDVLQKFRTTDNAHIADVNIGTGVWNSFAISPDSKKAFVVDMSDSGKIVVVDLENMIVSQTMYGFKSPHGSAINQAGDILYVTSQYGNFIYKIPLSHYQDYEEISLDTLSPPSINPSLDPHEIIFNSDFTKYYVTCQRSDEVRVMRTSDDKLLSVIQTSDFPLEMAISTTMAYLFVTCMSAENTSSTILGRVEVIDVSTNTIIKSIVPGHQPRGIAVSDYYNKVYVTNRNVSHGGPAGHHAPPGARNGYVVAIDMSTLELVPGYKAELTADPYSVSITH